MSQEPREFGALVLSITRGIVRNQRMRRTVLFFVVMGAMLSAFIGGVLIPNWLIERPWLFIFYWLGCLWLTVLTILMAIFDMLMIAKANKDARKALHRDYLGIDPDDKR